MIREEETTNRNTHHDNKRVRVIVSGRVQGVFFRAYTKEQAEKLALAGWVRNLPDRSVEAVLEGEAGDVERMLRWFKTGSPLSQVSRVLVQAEEPTGEYSTFEIR